MVKEKQRVKYTEQRSAARKSQNARIRNTPQREASSFSKSNDNSPYECLSRAAKSNG